MLGTAPIFQNGTTQCPQEKRGRTPLANLIRLRAAIQALSKDSKLQTYYGQKNEDRQGGGWERLGITHKKNTRTTRKNRRHLICR